MSPRASSGVPLLLLTLLALLAAGVGVSAGEVQSAGDAAYEAGRFAEALAAYRQAEAAGELNGVGLYRMGYCVGAVERNAESSREIYARAAERLGQEASEAGASLETHFYRVNVLLNLGKAEEARQAAARGAEAAEAGAFADRTDGTAWFRIGKMYRDAGRGPEALVPLARALDVWERDGAAVPAYVERIVSFALEENDSGLARRGAALLARTQGGRGRSAQAELALLVREGSLAEDRAFLATGALGLPPSDQRYVESLLDRLVDRQGQPVPLPTELPDGRPLRRLEAEEVRAELIDASRSLALLVARPPLWLSLRDAQFRARSAAAQSLLVGAALPCPGAALLVERRVSEILRSEVLGRTGPEGLLGAGWTAEERHELVPAYRLFLALAREALIRAAPLRAWATEGRYAPFLFKPLVRVARDRHGIRKSLAPATGDGDAPSVTPAGDG